MTERKPTGLSWQSWVDRQIREGQRGGAFDDLSGQGAPIQNIGVVHDEMWWVKAKLRDEDIEYLPPTIAIRADRAAAIEAAFAEPDKARARAIIDEVNGRIRYINSHSAIGPPSTATVIDTDEFFERWRVAHPSDESSDAEVVPVGTAAPTVARLRWWRRLFRRRPSPSCRPGRPDQSVISRS